MAQSPFESFFLEISMIASAKEQHVVAFENMYAAYNAQPVPAPLVDPVLDAAKAAYDETVNTLIALLGDDVHCNQVDHDLWGAFSDFYKSTNGFRPQGLWTRSQVKDWFSRS